MAAILNFSKTLQNHILKFGSIFKKSLAHPHVTRNVMLKFQKKLTKNFFWVFMPTKKLNWSMTVILNFSKASKKSPAHLHIMGNVNLNNFWL